MFLIILITLGVLHVLESRDIQGINHVRNDAMELHNSLRDPRCSEILQCNFWCMDLMYNEVSLFVEPIVIHMTETLINNYVHIIHFYFLGW